MRSPTAWLTSITTVLLAVGAGAEIILGPVPIPLETVIASIGSHLLPGVVGATSPAADFIVWNTRVPRAILAVVVGASLAVAGAALQALLRNPLADPFILGASSGGGLGAVLVIVLGSGALGGLGLSLAAFLGALLALLAIMVIGSLARASEPHRLIIIGVAISYALSGLTSAVIFTTGTERAAQAVLFWLLGSLGSAAWEQLLLPSLGMAVGLGWLLFRARQINAYVLGDETAASLGLPLRRFRAELMSVTAVMTGFAVAVSGGIGFVGLMVPHMVRLVIGADHRALLPLSALCGGALLVALDLAARMVVAPAELPISVLSSLLGSALLIALMVTSARQEAAR